MRSVRPHAAKREWRCRANPTSKTNPGRTPLTAQKGKNLLIKIADSAGTYDVALAGELTFAAEA